MNSSWGEYVFLFDLWLLVMTKHNSKLLPHLYGTCLSFVCALKLSTVSHRFPGNLCMTSWTRSWSPTSASQRASFSSTPSSGRDRWGFPLHGTFTLISSPIWLPPGRPPLFWTVTLVLTRFSRVTLQYVAELLHEQAQPIVSTCSAADVQAAFNTIVTRIQRLWVTIYKIFVFST